jgi:hypothetical protein
VVRWLEKAPAGGSEIAPSNYDEASFKNITKLGIAGKKLFGNYSYGFSQ